MNACLATRGVPRLRDRMTTAPAIDLEGLDLTRAVVDKAGIYELLHQRGKFAVLDGILHYDVERNFTVAYTDARAGDWWTTDHIPGRPIFPGALMVEAGAQTCAYDFMRRQKAGPETFVGFGGLENTRFRGLVSPGSRLVFVASVQRIRSRLFTYQVHGYVERELVFESGVLGVVV